MDPTKIIEKDFLRNFLIILLLLIFAGSAMSALVLYFNIERPLESHYGAILSIVTDVRDTLISGTLKTGIIYYLLIAAGAGVLSLLYTHRIAGPLYRIRMSTRDIAEGNLDTRIKLRRKDAVNSFAESINGMTSHYDNKVIMLKTETARLKDALAELKALKEAGKDTGPLTAEIRSIDDRVKQLLTSVKLSPAEKTGP